MRQHAGVEQGLAHGNGALCGLRSAHQRRKRDGPVTVTVSACACTAPTARLLSWSRWRHQRASLHALDVHGRPKQRKRLHVTQHSGRGGGADVLARVLGLRAQLEDDAQLAGDVREGACQLPWV